MPAKSAEEKAIEKQIKAQKDAEKAAKIRDRASGIVAGAHTISGFRILDSESEMMLTEILKQYDGNANNHVGFRTDDVPRSLSENAIVLYEALRMYGMIASVIPYGDGAILTITESAKAYFENKSLAQEKDEMIQTRSVAKNYKQYDVFISHANADKLDYVDELFISIRKLGISIFYDSDVLSWGDNWKKVILNGTESSEFAIIVISDNFFGREWTERELTEFLNRQNESGQKIILPLLHNVSLDDLKEKYPELGEIQCITTTQYSKDQITVLLAKELIKRYRQ